MEQVFIIFSSPSGLLAGHYCPKTGHWSNNGTKKIPFLDVISNNWNQIQKFLSIYKNYKHHNDHNNYENMP